MRLIADFQLPISNFVNFGLEQWVISLVLSPRTEMRRDPVVLAL
jgi:hypothetical protein